MKPKLIFFHGGPGFQDYLKPYFNSLEEQFECIFFDQLRGPQVEMNDLLKQLDDIIQSSSKEQY